MIIRMDLAEMGWGGVVWNAEKLSSGFTTGGL
jgi:hypothetical protein